MLAVPPRPKRLWVVTTLNVAIGIFGIVAVGFLLTSSKIPAELVPAKWSALSSIFIAATLIGSSVLALLGFRHARWVALVTAVAYFGTILIQNLLIFLHPEATFGHSISDRDSRMFLASVIRSAIEIGINVWGYLSSKTGSFFRRERHVP
jgi:hypothetical protein